MTIWLVWSHGETHGESCDWSSVRYVHADEASAVACAARNAAETGHDYHERLVHEARRSRQHDHGRRAGSHGRLEPEAQRRKT